MLIALEGSYSLASYRDDDVDSLVKHANDREVSYGLRDTFPFPYTQEDAKGWLAIACHQEKETLFALRDGDALIGGIGLVLKGDIYRFSAEIGYWLGKAYWGRGITTIATEAMLAYGFEQLGLHRIYAYVFEYNIGSQRVLEKCGFMREGVRRQHSFKHGAFHDDIGYSILASEWRARP